MNWKQTGYYYLVMSCKIITIFFCLFAIVFGLATNLVYFFVGLVVLLSIAEPPSVVSESKQSYINRILKK